MRNYRERGRKITEVKFTLREIIVSIGIVMLMIAIGMYISESISSKEMEKSEEYFKALKVKDVEMFNHAFETSVGNVLAEGTFKAIEPIENDNIEGTYLYILEEEEHYVKKTREVSYSCGEDTCYRTETYWEWEHYDEVEKYADEFKFLKKTFSTDDFRFTNKKYVGTVSGGRHVRYKYYAVPKEFEGSMFGKIKEKEITETAVYPTKNIKEVIQEKEDAPGNSVTIFWVVWSLFILIIVVVFMILENKYLNNKK